MWFATGPSLPTIRRSASAGGDLMREVFKPAALTADWRQLGSTRPELGRDALDGCRWLNATPAPKRRLWWRWPCVRCWKPQKRTAALVTPDRQLAEAVIAALRRWRIDVDDSAGRPLTQCPVGGYLQSLVTMLAEDFAPVSTLAFLKHPLVSGGLPPSDLPYAVASAGNRRHSRLSPGAGSSGTARQLAEKEELSSFFEQAIAAPLAELVSAWQVPAPSLASLAIALGDAAERMAARSRGADGNQTRQTGRCICGPMKMARRRRCCWLHLPSRVRALPPTSSPFRISWPSFWPGGRFGAPGRPTRGWPFLARSRRGCRALTG